MITFRKLMTDHVCGAKYGRKEMTHKANKIPGLHCDFPAGQSLPSTEDILAISWRSLPWRLLPPLICALLLQLCPLQFPAVYATGTNRQDSNETQETTSCQFIDFASDDGKKLISLAASLPFDATVDFPQKIPPNGESLTYLFLTEKVIIEPRPDRWITREFQFLTENPANVKVDLHWDAERRISVIQAKYIKQVCYVENMHSAEGVVAIEAPTFRGQVKFTAACENGQWRIESFVLPARAIAVRLGADGKWKKHVLGDKAEPPSERE